MVCYGYDIIAQLPTHLISASTIPVPYSLSKPNTIHPSPTPYKIANSAQKKKEKKKSLTLLDGVIKGYDI